MISGVAALSLTWPKPMIIQRTNVALSSILIMYMRSRVYKMMRAPVPAAESPRRPTPSNPSSAGRLSDSRRVRPMRTSTRGATLHAYNQ